MNKIYRIVRDASGRWVVASELAKGKRKASVSTASVLSAAVALLVVAPGAMAQSVSCGTDTVIAGAGQTCVVADVSLSSSETMPASSAMQANGKGAVVEASNVQSTANGDSAYAAYASGGGTVDIDGGIYQARGEFGHAVTATGAVSLITIEDAALATSGKNASGVRAQSGGTVRVSDASIDTIQGTGTAAIQGGRIEIERSTLNTGGSGLYSQYSGSQTVATDVTITSKGNGAHADSGSYITVIGGSIDAGLYGLYANSAGSTIDLSDAGKTTIVTRADNGRGAYALHGTVLLNNDTIDTYGKGAEGIRSTGSDLALVKAANTVVTTRGAAAHGGYANKAATIELQHSQLTTEGVGALGVWADGGKVFIDGGTIDTHGGASHGVYASSIGVVDASAEGQTRITTTAANSHGVAAGSSGTVLLSGDAVNTSGQTSYGLLSFDTGSRIEATATQVQTTGEGSVGAQVQAGGAVILTDSSVKADGVDAAGLRMGVAGDTAESQVVLTGSSIESAQASGIVIEGLADIAMDGSTVTAGNGVAMEVGTSAAVDLRANASTLNGAIVTAAGGTSDVALSNGSVWNMLGDSNVSSLINDGSTIAFALPVNGAFKTLTVSGDYAGQGGVVALNTVLGDDASLTDKLVVQGNTSGNSYLQVNNAGGTGADTLADGIQVVQVDGASEGSFALANRVTAGAYEYLLFQGGKNDPTDGDWYLRSEVPVTPEPPVDPPTPGPLDPAAPIDPLPVDPEPAPPTPAPLYRPETGAYLGNQAAVASMFMHTLHDRLGELDYSQRQRDEDGRGGSGWTRVQRNQFLGRTGQDQVESHTDTNIVQMGADLARWSQGDSRFHAGIMGGLGQARTHVGSNVTDYRAKGEVSGRSIGLYGTWYQSAQDATGAYVDSWVQYGDYENRVHGQGMVRERYDSQTLTGSVEAGYAFELGRGETLGYYLEPQAQVIYTDFRGGDHVDTNGMNVRSTEAGGVTTRLGARMYSRPLSEQHNRVQPFVEMNWWHGGEHNAMAFNGTELSQDRARDTYELKAGAQAELGKHWSGWASAGVRVGDQEDHHDVTGMIGLKRSW